MTLSPVMQVWKGKERMEGQHPRFPTRDRDLILLETYT